MLRISRWQTLSASALALAVWLSAPSEVLAQRMANMLTGPFMMNGREVLEAFREVVKTPRQSTVRIMAGPSLRDDQVALGTIISPDGWILTKASELRGAIWVRLANDTTMSFTVVGYHREHDLALIKIEPTAPLVPIEWTTAEPPMGQWMVSAGPQDTPVAIGVMSAKPRSIPRYAHGILGINLDSPTESPSSYAPRISSVTSESGAFAAGLKAGDLVLQVNGRLVDANEKLRATIQTFRPGDVVTLLVKRAEEELSVKVTLGYEFDDANRMVMQNEMGGKLSPRRDEFEAIYQHDAVLRPEDCGGPVVGLDGKAYGINIARAGRTESYVLPARQMISVIEDMKAGKYPAVASLTEGERLNVPRIIRRPRE